MTMKTRIKKFANNTTKSDALCYGVAIGTIVTSAVAVHQILGLRIIDINLIHDNVNDVDFLCVARANGKFQNLLFEYTPRP